jgi:prolipoprotein diacylglyceryltransferase
MATVVYHVFLNRKLQNNRSVFSRLFVILILVLIIGAGLLGWAFIDSQIFSYQPDSSPVKSVFKIFLKNYGNSIPIGLLTAVILPLLYTWVSAKTSKN